jgi:carbon-monoxide dehydrogenase medium subunit
VKPAPVEFLAATSVGEVVDALAADDEAKVLAGGQSLIPLLALRLARPTVLVDVNGLGLDDVDVSGTEARIGACTRHRHLERNAAVARAVPLLAEAVAQVGHPAVRNRGTIGGSLAHADPVGELPAVLVALGGSVLVRGRDGDREIAAGDLFQGFFTTTLAADELIVEVRIPTGGPGHGAAFCEWARRAGDFAVAGVGVVVERADDGRVVKIGAAACGIASVPLPLVDACSAALGERSTSDALLGDVAARVGDEVGDTDQGRLAGLLAARALHRAFTRSEQRLDRTA